jgi:hypothetical protein
MNINIYIKYVEDILHELWSKTVRVERLLKIVHNWQKIWLGRWDILKKPFEQNEDLKDMLIWFTC